MAFRTQSNLVFEKRDFIHFIFIKIVQVRIYDLEIHPLINEMLYPLCPDMNSFNHQ